MESESERKGCPKRKRKRKQRIDRTPVPEQTPPTLSSKRSPRSETYPHRLYPSYTTPHHNTHTLSLSLSFRTPQTSRKVVLKKTLLPCPAPTCSNTSNNKTNAQRQSANSRERRWVGGAWKQARLGKRRSIRTFRVGDWVRKKDGWMDGWMVSVSTIEDLIAYPLKCPNEHRYIPNRPTDRPTQPSASDSSSRSLSVA